MSEGIEVSERDVAKWGFAKLGLGKIEGNEGGVSRKIAMRRES